MQWGHFDRAKHTSLKLCQSTELKALLTTGLRTFQRGTIGFCRLKDCKVKDKLSKLEI